MVEPRYPPGKRPLNKNGTPKLRGKRSAAFRRGDYELVRKIDEILRRRAIEPDAVPNPYGRPFKPYKIKKEWMPAVQAFFERCNRDKITRLQLAERSGYSYAMVDKFQRRPHRTTLTKLRDMLHAVGLDLTATDRPASHGSASQTSSEGSSDR